MDVIRAALGYKKLNYVGVSYGTELGARYASLFPDSTGRMVLDSLPDITISPAEYKVLKAPAFQHILTGIVSPYIAAHNDVFGLGSTASDVMSITTSGPGWLTSFLGQTLSLINQSQIDDVIAELAAAKGINSVLATNPAISPDGLASEVAALQFSPEGGAPYEAAAKKVAMLAVDAYRDFSSGTMKPLGKR
jgi:pimeloyl-ACP methyl ester carboxylesterase